ncbi:hypothetical protein [Chitinophaga filiformis]|uniref:hypothetical protein n=1 Tax=Chitinophaga filiformis TaxID=104663 RepID=UPI0015A387A7|nr:hypothetical protein [Chitinophaga filiformis]
MNVPSVVISVPGPLTVIAYRVLTTLLGKSVESYISISNSTGEIAPRMLLLVNRV